MLKLKIELELTDGIRLMDYLAHCTFDSESMITEEAVNRLHHMIKASIDGLSPEKLDKIPLESEIILAGIEGGLIPAIKCYRNRTYCGLKEAKDTIESAIGKGK